jgi:hypothetical protein
LLPYASAAVAAVSVQKQVAGQYSFVDVLTVADFAPFAFYCVVLYPLMILVAATGLGREYE